MRGKSIRVREIKPDSIYNSVVVGKLINYVMLDGRKDASKKIVYEMIEKLSEQTKLDPMPAFEKVLESLKPKVEVRSRRVGGANYQVPVPVSEKRQLDLALRWLVDAARDARGNKPIAEALLHESLSALSKQGNAYKKKEDTHKMAEANKAFSHLTW